MKNKLFIIHMVTLALALAGTTMIYFSQMSLLYNYFDPDTVYIVTVCYSYLAQGAGLLGFMILYKYLSNVMRSRYILTGILLFMLPLLVGSMFIPSGPILMVLLVITNILIGYILANCFTNIAAFIDCNHVGLCWGAAYAIGNLISWLASQIDATFLSPIKMIPMVCILLGLTVAGIQLSENTPAIPMIEKETKNLEMRKYIWVILVIILMTAIYTIGSTDYSMIAENVTTSSTFYTRCFYAAGLFIAGYIYDKNHNVGAVLSLASIIYPVMATILLKIEFQINLVYCFSFFFLGFLAVYRATVFISFGNSNKAFLHLAGVGLLISRLAEGVFSLINASIARTEVAGFILCGVLFVPLIVTFFLMLLGQNQVTKPKSEEERLIDFAKEFSLTRREEEIVTLLLQNLTNGEIADKLTISEGTARFHVSNVLKKTGCKTRNDVIHKFKQAQK